MRIRRQALAACLTLCAAAAAAAHEPAEVDHAPDAAPVLIERVEALYPPEARAAGLSATVGLELTVEADGHVSGVKVVRAAGFGFDDSAVAAARQMHFRAAMHDGKPVASTVLFDQRFVLRPH